MELGTFITPEGDAKLKCFICKNYLSHFPIFLCSNNESLCGRCVCPEGLTSFHAYAFETICQFLKFPCRYKSEGCLQELVPKEVPQHEQNCSFRKVECILNKANRCIWSGTLPSLQHCRKTHSDVFLKNGTFQIDLSQNKHCDYLIEHNEKLLVFATTFTHETKLFRFALYSVQFLAPIVDTVCHLSIRGGNTTVSHDFTTSTFERKQFTELCLQCLSNDNPAQTLLLLGEIVIGRSPISSKRKRAQMEEDHSKFLSVLRYGVPIFNSNCFDCPDHDFCEECWEKIDTFGKKLRKISDLINYPCKNESIGCTYVADYDELETHYKHCKYEGVKCLLDASCKWTGRRNDASDHILKDHRDFVLDTAKVALELGLKDTNMRYRVLKLCHYLFRVAYCIKDGRYMWSVQSIGLFEEKFNYEISIADATGEAQKMVIRQPCSQLTKRKDIFGRVRNYCFFDKEQVDRFAGMDNKIGFRVEIFK